MRRRRYLHSLAGLVGSAGLTGQAASGRDVRSVDPTPRHAQAVPRQSESAVGADTATRSETATGTVSGAFEPLGRAALPTSAAGPYRAGEAVTTGDGAYAFVATVDGFRVVDLSTPADPTVVARRDAILADREGGPLPGILDLKYDRGYLLVAGPANGRTDLMGVALFDVTDPTDPSLRTFYGTEHSVHNCDLQGRYAYLTTGTALVVVDLARADPQRVGRWSVVDHDDRYGDVSPSLRNLHDVVVHGDRAYLAYWDAGSWILDVSDPADPSYLGHVAEYTAEELLELDEAEGVPFLEPPGNAHVAGPNGDGSLLAVGRESWDVETGPGDDVGGPSGIDLYDIADPSAPAHLATIDPPEPPAGESATRDGYWTTAHNFDVVGDYLYSSWYRGGVRIHDISDPADPVEVSAWADGDRASFWTAQAAVPGEYVVASSLRDPTDREAPGALYVFPDPTDNPARATRAPESDAFPDLNPTPTATLTPDDTALDGGDGPATATPGTPPGGSTTATPTATESDTPTADAPVSGRSETDGTAPSTAADGPGFGPLAALAGLGLGAWRLRGDE